MNINEYKNYLIDYLQNQLQITKKKGIIIGVSGGIDSAVLACLTKLACRNDYLCVFLPCENNSIDYATTNELIYKFILNFKQVDINDSYLLLKQSIEKSMNSKCTVTTLGNIKARLRMTTLYALANELDYLVVGTTNRSENYLGYYSKFGDGAADIYPLIGLWKSEIYQLAKLFKIPEIIIERPPSASLYQNQSDEVEMGFTYNELEKFIQNPLNVSKSIVNKITTRHNQNFHKTNSPKNPKNFIE